MPPYESLVILQINDTFNVALAQSPAFRNLDFTATSVRTLSSETAVPRLPTNSEEGTHASSTSDGEHISSSSTHAAAGDADLEQHVSSSTDQEKRAIVGGVVGAVCGLILIGGIVVYCLRRRRKQRILSTPLRAVSSINHSTIPSPVATQDGSDRMDEKDSA